MLVKMLSLIESASPPTLIFILQTFVNICLGSLITNSNGLNMKHVSLFDRWRNTGFHRYSRELYNDPHTYTKTGLRFVISPSFFLYFPSFMVHENLKTRITRTACIQLFPNPIRLGFLATGDGVRAGGSSFFCLNQSYITWQRNK